MRTFLSALLSFGVIVVWVAALAFLITTVAQISVHQVSTTVCTHRHHGPVGC